MVSVAPTTHAPSLPTKGFERREALQEQSPSEDTLHRLSDGTPRPSTARRRGHARSFRSHSAGAFNDRRHNSVGRVASRSSKVDRLLSRRDWLCWAIHPTAHSLEL